MEGNQIEPEASQYVSVWQVPKYPWEDVLELPVISQDTLTDYNSVELEVLLEQAILLAANQCLKDNDGKIYMTLSGGLDSSFCLAKIRQLLGRNARINTYTTGCHAKHPDVLAARAVSNLFQTFHHEWIASPAQIKEMEDRERSYNPKTENARAEAGVWLTYQYISESMVKSVISHDGIDELLGGYWLHRNFDNVGRKQEVFQRLWSQLKDNHLSPLVFKAGIFGISVIFPYLNRDLVEYITRIPVGLRTDKFVSKKPLRKIAEKYLPKWVIDRPKIGFCDALERKDS